MSSRSRVRTLVLAGRVGVLATAVTVGVLGGAGVVARFAATPDPAVSVPSGPTGPVAPAPTDEAVAKPGFAEECSGPALRPEWRPLLGPDDPGFGMESDFLGDLSHVTVENGTCTIRAARVATPSGRPYASAAISTRGTFAQRYGTFEARVRYSAGQGVWPAFWLLQDRDIVATPPEIDVFEAYPGATGDRRPNVVASTLHYAGGSHHFVHRHDGDLTRDFHVHRLTWTPGLLVFSIDGIETGRITRDVPDVAMFPILNLAMGARGFRTDATTPDVATLEIDYVRIWAP